MKFDRFERVIFSLFDILSSSKDLSTVKKSYFKTNLFSRSRELYKSAIHSAGSENAVWRTWVKISELIVGEESIKFLERNSSGVSSLSFIIVDITKSVCNKL